MKKSGSASWPAASPQTAKSSTAPRGSMLYWVNNGENTGKPKWVGEDVRKVTPVVLERPDGTTYETHIADGLICDATATKISPSGKWIASTYRTEEISENKQAIKKIQKAAFYNTETETTTIVEDYGESMGMYVTDDGIAFIAIGTYASTSSVVYDLNTGTDLGDMADWIKNNYGIIVPDGNISRITPDGSCVLGFSPLASASGVNFFWWYIAPPLEE